MAIITYVTAAVAPLIIVLMLYPTTITVKPWEMKTSYDYIIVGAGSAGCVIATRLSEHPEISVLLVEAGAERQPFYSHVPGLVPHLQASDIDWQFFTEGNSKFEGLINGRHRWPRGKTLGGTSVINYMQAHRGHRENYDEWEQSGNQNWSFENMLQYFKKSENTMDESVLDNGYHGRDGPLTVSRTARAPRSKMGSALLDGLRELKFPIINDPNNPETPEGLASSINFIRSGKRCSTYECYLKTAIGRKNLDIITDAHVTRINIDDDRKAIGITYDHYGRTYMASASREVILSAGSIGSPQLLLLSGIGDRNHLVEHNIETLVHSPQVGKNMMDHVLSFLYFVTNESVCTHSRELLSPRSIYQYLRHRTGPLAVTPVELWGSMDSGIGNHRKHGLDLQFYFFPSVFIAKEFVPYHHNMKPEVAEEMSRNAWNNDGKSFNIHVTLQLPESRGRISLKSSDPHAHPKIEPNYFDHPNDIKVLVKGWRMMFQLLKTNALKRYQVKWSEEVPAKQCSKFDVDSDAFLECRIKLTFNTLYHPMGTCRMGQNISTSVVDDRLRVHGVRHLRVADASIFPSAVSGNTNWPVIAVAEKATDLILNSFYS